ncbi:hypothetical protein [Microbacterium sp. NPDC056052]|uniref:hypothetical protein n=1 Tax=Microbacterium sp. NPDC056052 TaxID=3345695 RepID=UPI0035D953D7
MSSIPPLTPIDNAPVTDGPSFLARSKKAVAGGIAGAVTGGTGALTTAFADGSFSQADAWLILAAVVGGFAVGFAGVWGAPANAR